MRLFVAIDLNENVIGKISEIQERLRSGDFDLKCVEPENLHLTLKFLGEVDEKQNEYMGKLISEAAKEFHEFTLSFHGIGYFGERRMNVIWAGVNEGKEEFVKLAQSLDGDLSFVRKDEHEPSPHLTIARVRSGRNREILAREIRSLGDVKIGEVHVKEIKLKQSVLTPQGPIYSDVKIFPLSSRR
ncbi:MAG: RNA 2',3'-cyclic phosphodiesterase [Candidatus Aenigmarchaeota archaeon]|nr:RNA 2',3'-cyclic phosphodiesterase [Candidatus Aenigmarchaeota archaeon]